MKKKLFGFFRTNREGLALISVLGVVTLATILILALFSVSDAEFKSARNYADGAMARQLADNTVNLVISQIQAAATGVGVPNGGQGGSIWASQPGGVRVYQSDGEFVVGRKLYSATEMVVNGFAAQAELEFSRSAPPEAWDESPSAWVDLNEPIVRTVGGASRTYFPIVDPRAAMPLPNSSIQAIEGFSYSGNLPFLQGRINGVVDTGNLDDLRVPMPVEWLYVLKDGSMGTMEAGGGGNGLWTGVAGAGLPSLQNPIVGRVGFWTDDESCRVNINTAGEPGFYATPTVFHGRDWNWANSQPVLFEYQRYPGHPATVALSSVLHPNPTHSYNDYDADSYPTFPPSYRDLKDLLTGIAPKLAAGGSGDGTLSFAPDEFSSNVSPEADKLWDAAKPSLYEHPFVSVDEMIFKNIQGANGRERMYANSPSAGDLISPESLERARFFLTAQSRAPEINMYGYPRVAIWPVPDESLGANFRTVYDSSIAYAGSLGSAANAYYFRRRDANSGLVDIGADSQVANSGLLRNGLLMTYLDKMIATTGIMMPGGVAGRGNFGEKYGQDSKQILVQIFDYIRITNLFDSFLDEKYVKDRGGKRDFWDDVSPVETGGKLISLPAQQSRLWKERPAEFSYYTYTAPRFDTIRRVDDLGANIPTAYRKDYVNERVTTGMYPGHGQVRPIEWNVEGTTYRGFGRFPTISEIALHFICTADGKNGPGSFVAKPPANGETPNWSGGKSAKKIDPNIENRRVPKTRETDTGSVDDFWYSNIPPYPSYDHFIKWGCSFGDGGDDTNAPDSWTKHPGYNPKNWNTTLDTITDDVTGEKVGVELKEDEKRIQIALQIEMFVPAVGYTKYAPDFTIKLDEAALANLKVKDANGNWLPIFSVTEPQVIQSTVNYMGSALGEHQGSTNISPVGGSYGSTPFMAGRVSKGIGEVPADSGYQTASSSDEHSAMLNFPLVSNYFTVKRDKPIEFSNEGERSLRIDIYASHETRSGKNSTPTQSVYVKFPSGNTPTPKLVVYSTEKRKYFDSSGGLVQRDATHAPRWWSFNAGGALNRYEGSPRYADNKVFWRSRGARVDPHTLNIGVDGDTRGRFQSLTHVSTTSSDPNNQWATVNATIPMSSLIYGYSPLPNFQGVKSRPEDLPQEDTFQDQQGTMGAYGFYGSDSLRSIMPTHGDYRLLAARKVVPASVWKEHRVWLENPNNLFAHSLSGTAGPDNGFDTGAKPTEAITQQWAHYRMVQGAWYPANQVPDTRMTADASKISTESGDFDNGPGDVRDGPYINKADDGNLSVGQLWYPATNSFAVTRNAYFISTYLQFPSRGSFFTPNRMISSPGIFGSLPTGVYGSQAPADDSFDKENGVPWRTLLFRPDTTISGRQPHKGAHTLSPADHYMLDFFWMPVILPYAISDSFSTAGKINLNYHMLGFSHIKRATALHAAMKGELLTAFSHADVNPTAIGAPGPNKTIIYKTAKSGGDLTAKSALGMWGSGDPMDWHRKINIDATLRQLESRFYFEVANSGVGTFNGLLRTPSQLCELHLVPMPSRGTVPRPEGALETLDKSSNTASIVNEMSTFWEYNNITGDNTRERPYANLYQKFTTRSNTFRTYFISQTIKKARSVSPTEFDSQKDSVTAEYRGSALIERYLPFTASEAGTVLFKDYADGSNPFGKPSLEFDYRYRVLEMKQFSP